MRENAAAELRAVVEERDALTAELEEAHELLRQAERVRESQIALEAERDRLAAELGKLQIIASDAQAEVEERSRLLVEEQDARLAERESLLAQRTLLEEELGSSIEQLAAAGAAADERDAQIRRGSERLVEALDAVRRIADELVSGAAELPEERAAEIAEAVSEEIPAEEVEEAETSEPETEEAEAEQPATEGEEIEYSLFVPGPNGYELVPQTGVPPQAGQTVELVLNDQEEPTLYEVVRSGGTLPDGDVCVYLAQV